MGFFGSLLKGVAGFAANMIAPGLGSSILGSQQQDAQNQARQDALAMNQANLEAQQRENRLNRQFNASEAEKSFSRQTQMLKYIQDYNSPVSQMQRLREAGLNPNLAYGQLQDAMPSGASSAPSASYSNGISPSNAFHAPDYSVSLAAQNSAFSQRTQKAEASILESDASFRDAMNSNNLTLSNLSITGLQFDNDIKQETISNIRSQTAKLDEELNLLKAEVDETMARIANLNEDFIAKRLNNLFTSRTFEDAVAKFSAEAHISVETAKNIATYLTLQNSLASSQCSANMAAAVHSYASAHNLDLSSDSIEIRNGVDREYAMVLAGQQYQQGKETIATMRVTRDGLKIDNKYKDRYGDAEHIIGIANAGAQCVGTIVKSFNPFSGM